MIEGVVMIAGWVAIWHRVTTEVEQGLADLRKLAAETPEWKRVSYGPSGAGGVSAARAQLLGMADHVEAALARSRLPIYDLAS